MTVIEIETMHAIKAAARAIANKEINWEQRRYEIVKDMVCATLASGMAPSEIDLDKAIHNADYIIAELKKNTDNK